MAAREARRGSCSPSVVEALFDLPTAAFVRTHVVGAEHTALRLCGLRAASAWRAYFGGGELGDGAEAAGSWMASSERILRSRPMSSS